MEAISRNVIGRDVTGWSPGLLLEIAFSFRHHNRENYFCDGLASVFTHEMSSRWRLSDMFRMHWIIFKFCAFPVGTGCIYGISIALASYSSGESRVFINCRECNLGNPSVISHTHMTRAQSAGVCFKWQVLGVS